RSLTGRLARATADRRRAAGCVADGLAPRARRARLDAHGADADGAHRALFPGRARVGRARAGRGARRSSETISRAVAAADGNDAAARRDGAERTPRRDSDGNARTTTDHGGTSGGTATVCGHRSRADGEG